MGLKYFVSDFHFGVKSQFDFSILSSFESFCEKILANGDELYILGDFFDFWIEYKNFVPSKFVKIYATLLNAQKRGVKIFIVRGNHDFIRGNFFDNLNISVFDNEIRFEQNGRKFLCTHGDEISKSSGYSAMKSVLRNGFFQFLYKLIPPDFAVWFAETLSSLSRKKNGGETKSETRKSKYRKNAFDFAEKENCDILIMGHSHIPDLSLTNNKIYANSGVWFEKPTYIMLEENKILLKEFRDGNEKDVVLHEILLSGH